MITRETMLALGPLPSDSLPTVNERLGDLPTEMTRRTRLSMHIDFDVLSEAYSEENLSNIGTEIHSILSRYGMQVSDWTIGLVVV